MKKQGTREQGNEGAGEEIRDQRAELITRPPWRRFGSTALILLCATVASVPQIVRGPSCGHDFDFHLVSWLDALSSWRHGVLYPRWTPSPNFGAGEPRFIFYPPLTWMAGGLLGAILPWHAVPVALLFLLFAATGLATRALARQVFGDAVATLAGCAAIFSGYALFTAYERSAFAEMTGGFWVPLMLMLMLRDDPGSPAPAPQSSSRWMVRGLDRTALLLSFVVAGAWLSNAPLGVMLSYLLAAMAVATALLRKSWAPVARATVGAALGLGLAAIFSHPRCDGRAMGRNPAGSGRSGTPYRKQLAVRAPRRPTPRVARHRVDSRLGHRNQHGAGRAGRIGGKLAAPNPSRSPMVDSAGAHPSGCAVPAVPCLGFPLEHAP
jgi:hypothetical protein